MEEAWERRGEEGEGEGVGEGDGKSGKREKEKGDTCKVGVVSSSGVVLGVAAPEWGDERKREGG